MDFRYICQQTLKSHNKIGSVWILREVNPIEGALKKGFPLPNADEFNKMCTQGWTILGQISTNQLMYGKTEYVIVSLEKLYRFLIPIDQRHYMAISCAKPCNPMTIIRNVKKVMAEEEEEANA